MWLKVFVPCFAVFHVISEVGLSFVPQTQQRAVGLSWILWGVLMLLWGYLGDWEGS